MSILKTCQGCLKESIEIARILDRATSRLRGVADVWLSRALVFMPRIARGERRRVRCRDGIWIVYRLNRGDLQSIREVICGQAYRLPFKVATHTLVDLGANIGLSSVWLHAVYGFSTIIAIEPDSENAELARENLALNEVPGEVITAAIGPTDGVTQFTGDRIRSNMGKLANSREDKEASAKTQVVPMMTMHSVMAKFPASQRVDVLKMDIEGGEVFILTGDRSWLSRVDSIICELHPSYVDCGAIVAALDEEGFDFIPANSMECGNMTAFVRRNPS